MMNALAIPHLDETAGGLRPGENKPLNALVQECLGINHQLALAVHRGLPEYVGELEAMFASANGQDQVRRLPTS